MVGKDRPSGVTMELVKIGPTEPPADEPTPEKPRVTGQTHRTAAIAFAAIAAVMLIASRFVDQSKSPVASGFLVTLGAFGALRAGWHYFRWKRLSGL